MGLVSWETVVVYGYKKGNDAHPCTCSRPNTLAGPWSHFNVITRFPGIPLYVFRFPRRSLPAFHGLHVFVVEKINIVRIVRIAAGSPTGIRLFAAFFSLLGVKRLLLPQHTPLFQQPMLVRKIVRVNMARQQNPHDQQCEEARCYEPFASMIHIATRSQV